PPSAPPAQPPPPPLPPRSPPDPPYPSRTPPPDSPDHHRPRPPPLCPTRLPRLPRAAPSRHSPLRRPKPFPPCSSRPLTPTRLRHAPAQIDRSIRTLRESPLPDYPPLRFPHLSTPPPPPLRESPLPDSPPIGFPNLSIPTTHQLSRSAHPGPTTLPAPLRQLAHPDYPPPRHSHACPSRLISPVHRRTTPTRLPGPSILLPIRPASTTQTASAPAQIRQPTLPHKPPDTSPTRLLSPRHLQPIPHKPSPSQPP